MEQEKIINGKKYKYVWGDEFDENSIHYAPFSEEVSAPDKWKLTGMMGYFPDFDIPADPEDIKKYSYVENGELVLKAGCFDWSKKYKVGDKTFTGRTVTENHKFANGAVLATNHTMVYRKGYAEIRAKLPFNNGAWPAWWTRSIGSPLIKYPEFGGTDQTDPVYTFEIDMIETWAYIGEYVYPNIHKWYKNHFVNDGTTDRKGFGKVYDYDGNDVTDQIEGVGKIEYNGEGKATQFTCNIGGIYNKTGKSRRVELKNPDEYHTYGFLWTDDEMTFSIDGEDYFTMDLTKEFDGYHDGKYGWNQYMYFIFDCHFMTPMASWGGNPEQRYSANGDTSDIEMRVDYIRLYQEEGKEDIIIK